MKSLFYILLAFLLFVIGCDIFETRDPEKPSQTKSNYTTPTEPNVLIQNIVYAFSDRNAENYKKSFIPGPPVSDKIFYFIPTSYAQSKFSGKWTDWNIDDEYDYFLNLVNDVPNELPISLIFSNDNENLLGDSVIYTAEYSINVPKQNSESEVYEGSVKFTLIRDNVQSIWFIYYWEDIAKEGFKSWSELKGENHL